MAKRADFTIEPDLMKGEIDEHGKLREPFVRLPGEPDHWTLYLKVGDCVCDDYSRRSARRRMVIARGREAAAKRAGPDHCPRQFFSGQSAQSIVEPSGNSSMISRARVRPRARGAVSVRGV